MNNFFLILILIISFSALAILYNLIVNHLVEKAINVKKHIPKWSQELKDEINLDGIKHENIIFETSDNLLLNSLLIHSRIASKGNIIFIHGLRTNKYYFLNEAIFFSSKGYNCILIDLRGHGDSEGIHTTFGFLEKIDISLLIDIATSKYELPNNFGLWGHSMGASIAIQTLELDKRIGFMILEAPFSNLAIILREYFERKLWFFASLFFIKTLTAIEKKLNIKISEIDPSKSAKSITQPTIIIHGSKDNRILPYHSNNIFNNLPGNNKIIYEIKDADHHNIREVWKKEYLDVTLTFINDNINHFQFTN